MDDRTGFDTATRVAAGDDGTTYDKVAIALHWVTAALVLFQFVSSFIWDWFAKPSKQALESVHVSLGILLAAVVIARLLWRWMPGHQVSSLEVGWVKIASKSVHYLLYALLVAQAVLGFVIGWAAGHPIHFFGIPIPGPFEALDRPLRHEIREIHEKVGYAIVILAAGHALAALYHHYALRDRVLGRMLPWARRSERGWRGPLQQRCATQRLVVCRLPLKEGERDMTKSLALLGAAVLIVSTGACEKYDKAGASDAASVTAAIKADEKAWNEQFKAKDQNALTARYADDANFTVPGAPPASGSTAIAKVYAEALSDPAFSVSFASDKIDVSSAGDMAVSSGHFTEKYTDPKTGKPMVSSGGYVTVYKKQSDGKWKVTEDITSAAETKEVAPGKPAMRAKMVSFG